MMIGIRFVLNGEEKQLDVEPNLTLLDLLRDRLHVPQLRRRLFKALRKWPRSEKDHAIRGPNGSN